MPLIRAFALIPALLIATAMPGHAQKAKDTLRIAFADHISTILQVDDPKGDTRATTDAVFDTLVCYDAPSKSFKPLLATSWKQVDDLTLEFKLRDDVKFHDGSTLTADDVVYTLNWLVDPNNKLRYDELNWMAKAVKLDATTVQIVSKSKTPIALMRIALSAHIYPAKIHAAFETKSDFGRKNPVGTGPYKVVSVDSSKGIVLVKNGLYRAINDCKPAATIGTIQITPILDSQTRMAQLMVGGIDLTRADNNDEVKMATAVPTLMSTATTGVIFHYLAFDAIGRSGVAPLSNPKVRQALVQGINRDLIMKTVVAGGDQVKIVNAICVSMQQGCVEPTIKPFPYDAAAAKRLLTEAGYPNGFDLEITAMPASHSLGEALTGELRKLGIRANLEKVSFPTYRSKQVAGKLQALAGQWTSLGLPDLAPTMDFYFSGQRDYWNDADIKALAAEAAESLDLKVRETAYRKIFDRINERSYILPLSTMPGVFIHTKDIQIAPDSINVYGAVFQELRWK